MTNNEQLSFEVTKADNTPVVCLGMTFESEEARREYFRDELRKKLPELKKIEGFPIGEDEDIIALSDPPYYTACPNPWINDFIEEWEKEKVTKYGPNLEEYHREPFAADVSEGKTSQIYLAHSYHTKVPHKAIMRYLLHYTNPGDIILDGFSGTGMTGVAAALCNNRNEVVNLEIKESEKKLLGERKVILNDLSTAASFISNGYNNNIDPEIFLKVSTDILKKINDEFGWMFETYHENSEKQIGKINYTVWSDVFSCPNCNNEIVFYNEGFNQETLKVNDEFNCPSCQFNLNKKKLDRIYEYQYDELLDKNFEQIKKVPVMINYTYKKKVYNKSLDSHDLEVMRKIEEMPISSWVPTYKVPKGEKTSEPLKYGITHIHHFYSKRALLILGKMFELVQNTNENYKHYLLYTFEQAVMGLSKIARYVPTHFSQVNQYLSGTLYVASLSVDPTIDYILVNKVNRLYKLLKEYQLKQHSIISTQSLSSLKIRENSVDYIFTDPPFGANLMYSELNLLWESWKKVLTNNQSEAIMNKVQGKNLVSYQGLMEECFKVYYHVLKPGRWITVEFSNSKASVWNSIQEALQRAGFIIANVAALNKKQGSFNAIMSTTAVKQDLVISAFKPKMDNFKEIVRNTVSNEGVWTFVSQYLENLVIFNATKGEAQVIAERTPRILFDRMVAYHVQNGLPVPISSAEFQVGVTQRFPMRDGMAFLESQVAEYDKKRTLVKEFTQMSLFVSDENSSIEWIRQQLMKKPQTRQDLHPQFMKEIQNIAKHEQLPELDDLLAQNFLRYEGEETVPDQIASYLRRNFHDMRGLENTDSRLKAKAMNRWYVPDPNKQADLEKLREKTLLREFDHYIEELGNSKKKLKQFRTEAIRAGFKKAWSEKNYEKIVTVGDRLPEQVIQEDDKLLMYYDNAQVRLDM
ncbi:DNA methyltransferase [Robertmurraya beringensis]|uniref:DNA methyltransferase n=1 Tax=Robertmurraya beringensis TaxID=641660 RepID=A0ABV6KTM2_9BACI